MLPEPRAGVTWQKPQLDAVMAGDAVTGKREVKKFSGLSFPPTLLFPSNASHGPYPAISQLIQDSVNLGLHESAPSKTEQRQG